MQEQVDKIRERLVKVRESLVNEKAWIEANILGLSRAINELDQLLKVKSDEVKVE